MKFPQPDLNLSIREIESYDYWRKVDDAIDQIKLDEFRSEYLEANYLYGKFLETSKKERMAR